MNVRPLAGLLGCISIAVLCLVGLYSVVNSYLIESTDLLAPSAGAAIVALVVVGALLGIGAGAGRQLETPYW